MSNSICIQKSIVHFSEEEMDIPGFLATIKEGREAHEKLELGIEVDLPPSVRKLREQQVDEGSLVRACADMVEFFVREKEGCLQIDFYPENYRGDVTYISFAFLVNRIVRPFVKREKMHAFELADWAAMVEEGDETWTPFPVNMLVGIADD